MPKAKLQRKHGNYGKFIKLGGEGKTPFTAMFPSGLDGFDLGEEVTYAVTGKKVTVTAKGGKVRAEGQLD